MREGAVMKDEVKNAGFGVVVSGLSKGTPDLAAASKLVTDEHQHRLPRLGLRDAGQ
jgi:hypothetical protein